MEGMDEQLEFQKLGILLVQIANSESFQSCSEDEGWIAAEKRMMKMARKGGSIAMGRFLGLLRKPDLPEQVADVVAKAIALCCGPCAAPPALRTFIFSPSLSVKAPGFFPMVAADEYDQQCVLSLADVICRRLGMFNSRALIVTPVRDKEMLDQFLKEVDRLGMSTKVEQVDEQEWNNCRPAMYGLDGNDVFDEDGTMCDMEHYEGGILITFKMKAIRRDIAIHKDPIICIIVPLENLHQQTAESRNILPLIGRQPQIRDTSVALAQTIKSMIDNSTQLQQLQNKLLTWQLNLEHYEVT